MSFVIHMVIVMIDQLWKGNEGVAFIIRVSRACAVYFAPLWHRMMESFHSRLSWRRSLNHCVFQYFHDFLRILVAQRWGAIRTFDKNNLNACFHKQDILIKKLHFRNCVPMGNELINIHCKQQTSIEISKKLYPNKPLYLEVRTWNIRVVKCYQKAGFRIDGQAYELTTGIGTGTFYRMIRE